jgi:hypothetical protein
MDTAMEEKAGQAEAREREVTVTVNRQHVTFQERTVTGLQIKQVAIEQHVHIDLDFVLFELEHSGELKLIGDQEKVELHEGTEFRATDADDNS